MIIIPVALADILVEIYHRICFPLYGMAYVKRSQYIRITDREKLPYLSLTTPATIHLTFTMSHAA